MIDILIVEDSPVKLEKVINLLETETTKGSIHITEINNIKEAKKLMFTNKYDLLILDLVLPLESDDDSPSAEKGLNLLEDIYSNPMIKQPVHILGLTEFSELKPDHEKEFNKKLNHLINYQHDAFNWKDQLKSIVWTLVEREQSFFDNRNTNYNYDIAIITAVEVEFNALKNLNLDWKEKRIENDATTYIDGIITTDSKKLKIVGAMMPQMGMVSASVLTMKLIQNFRPRYVIMIGIAGCLKKNEEFNYGDILITDQSWDGGAGKITSVDGDSKFEPGAKYISLDADIRERIVNLKDNKELLNLIREQSELDKPSSVLNIHIGPVASVAGVIENEAVVNELKSNQRKIIGVEMETYGVFYTANNCSNPKPKAISIKSVSDFADMDKNDKYQKYASYTSANFMLTLAKTEL